MFHEGPRAARAYLHVGLPKTGTSYLQTLVWANLDELRRQGLVVVPDPSGHPSKPQPGIQVMLALRGRLVPGEDAASSDEVLDRFADEVRDAGDADVLLTQEQLGSCGRPQVDAFLERLGDREVHVVVTVRPMSRTIPSAWQERVKTRNTASFEDFIAAVRDREASARGFWRNHDLAAVFERWCGSLPPERVHVVTVPAGGGAPDELDARFFGVLGIDHTRLDPGAPRRNSSLGVVQAELLRRVNLALGDRLPKPRRGYARVAKWYLAEKFLMPQGGQPPILPQSAETWCRQLAEEWIALIRAAGYDVAGDLDDLLPRSTHFAPGLPVIGEAEQAEAAARALADILVHRDQELARIDALTARVAELEARTKGPQPSDAPKLWRRLARRH